MAKSSSAWSSRLADACIGRGMQHALAADDAARVAPRQRPADPHQARPVDLLVHAEGEADGLVVAVEAGEDVAFLRRDAEPAERQLPRSRLGAGGDAEPPSGCRVDIAIDPDAAACRECRGRGMRAPCRPGARIVGAGRRRSEVWISHVRTSED